MTSKDKVPKVPKAVNDELGALRESAAIIAPGWLMNLKIGVRDCAERSARILTDRVEVDPLATEYVDALDKLAVVAAEYHKQASSAVDILLRYGDHRQGRVDTPDRSHDSDEHSALTMASAAMNALNEGDHARAREFSELSRIAADAEPTRETAGASTSGFTVGDPVSDMDSR